MSPNCLNLFDSAEIANFTPKEKAQYEHDMTTERDIRNYIAFARKEGREEGARKKALETARALLSLGVSMDIITKSTGVPEEEIQRMAGRS